MSTITLPLVGTVPNIVTEIGTQRGGRDQVRLHVRGRRLHGAGRRPGGRGTARCWCWRRSWASPRRRPSSPPPRPPRPGPPRPPRPPRRRPPAPALRRRAGHDGAATPTAPPPPPTSDHHHDDHPAQRSRDAGSRSATPDRWSRPSSTPPRPAWSRCRWPPGGQPWARPPPSGVEASHRVAVVAAQSAWLLGWPGQQVTSTTTLHPVPPGRPARAPGSGTARFALGDQIESVPLKLGATVPEPSWWWRLVHG